MGVSRRRFLESSAIMAAASATGLATLAAALDKGPLDKGSFAPTNDVISRLSLADAKFLVGSVFVVRTSQGQTELHCVEVKATAKEEPNSNPHQAFSMKFQQIDSAAPLKEGTYQFKHGMLGQFRLFIIPSGRGITPRSYTAIINHQDRAFTRVTAGD